MQCGRARPRRRRGWATRARVGWSIRIALGIGAALAVALLASTLRASEPFGPRDTETAIEDIDESSGYPASLQVASAALRVPGVLVPDAPWRRFSVVARVEAGQPAIAIVIDDLGESAREVDDVLALGEQMTLSFLPDGPDAPWLARYARRAGHEVLVHVPMEPIAPGYRLGPYGLRVAASGSENLDHLAAGLSRFGAFVGINNHMGSRFTSNAESMAVVLAELKRRGLMFLDSRTSAETQGDRIAALLEVPHAMRDVFIDAEMAPDRIAFELARLEQVAREKGIAIAIAHPRPMTLRALRAWLPAARERGFAFVPISYAAKLNCGC